MQKNIFINEFNSWFNLYSIQKISYIIQLNKIKKKYSLSNDFQKTQEDSIESLEQLYAGLKGGFLKLNDHTAVFLIEILNKSNNTNIEVNSFVEDITSKYSYWEERLLSMDNPKINFRIERIIEKFNLLKIDKIQEALDSFYYLFLKNSKNILLFNDIINSELIFFTKNYKDLIEKYSQKKDKFNELFKNNMLNYHTEQIFNFYIPEYIYEVEEGICFLQKNGLFDYYNFIDLFFSSNGKEELSKSIKI